MKIVADNGEGCTVEEGTSGIDIASNEVVLVLRPDMTHRLIIPSIKEESQVSRHVLALTAIAILARDNPDWVDELCSEVFGDSFEEESDGSVIPFGPKTKGSA